MKFPSKTIAVGTVCAVLGGGGIATAATTGLIDGHTIKKGSIPTTALNQGAQQAIGRASHYTHGPRGLSGPAGVQGPAGAKGATGPAGPVGRAGAGGFNGAFYSVEKYPSGAGSGAVATVACVPGDATASQKYVAISGGVQDTDNSTDMSTLSHTLPIAASFPGRMDWTTNTPLPNRLDGWIVQLGNGSGQDTPMSVWAMCVPASNAGGTVPVVTNSAS